MYSIYKTTNNITGKFYVGKQSSNRTYYLGSGKLLQRAIVKHGKNNFTKIILEDNLTAEQASVREQYWIKETGALSNQGYNMNTGGAGGDNSRHIDYANRKIKFNINGFKRYWQSLTTEQREQKYKEQGMARSKGWYVSKVNGTKETYIQNIAEWCDKHGVDKSMPTRLNNTNDHCFQKQTKGWRIRRADMPKLPPYENRRHIATDNGCKGKTWRLVAGKRVWVSE